MLRSSAFLPAILTLVGALSMLDPAAAAAQGPRFERDTTRLLYHHYGYGSDAAFGPMAVLLNKGYEILQVRQANRRVFTLDYGRMWQGGVVQPLRYPASVIQRFGGWGRFARVELLPLSFRRDEMNWTVNYSEHLIAGGLTMRMLDEYYRVHGVPLPRLTAALTTYAASAMNEMQELPNEAIGGIAGTVADLLFFDTGALLLFQFDWPARVLTRTLRAADWSPMGALTFPDGEVVNNGIYYVVKPPLGLKRTRLFARIGLGGQVGLSRALDDAHSLSIGLGSDTQQRFVDKATGHETVEFAPSAGIFYDRHDSLLWSVVTSPGENVLSVNVYPGVLTGRARPLGVWANYTRSGRLSLGVLHGRALGMGMGLGINR